MSSQQGAVSLTTTWQEKCSADNERRILMLQNNDPSATVSFLFGMNPQDADALQLGPGDSILLDVFVPLGALWMKASAATDAVVMLKG